MKSLTALKLGKKFILHEFKFTEEGKVKLFLYLSKHHTMKPYPLFN